MSEPASASAATFVARLAVDALTARRIADLLAESLDPAETTTAVYEMADGRWSVEAHFRHAPDQAALRDLVALAAGPDTARALTFETVADKDWVAASFAGLPPVAAGRFVVHGRHDRAHVPSNRIGIEIEAALAFGTGHHGTTRGCLLALDVLLKSRRPRRILDIGTGTGVLAIAAAKALHRPVIASDIDRRAVTVARDNAKANAVGSFVETIHAAGLASRRFRQRRSFDLVLANILLGPLKRLATPIAGLLAPSARVVLSGLLPHQANAALAAYRAHGLALERRIEIEGWTTLVLARRAAHRAPGHRRPPTAPLRRHRGESRLPRRRKRPYIKP